MVIKGRRERCYSNARLVSLFAKRSDAGQLSFFGLGSEKKWSSFSEDSPQGERDKMAEKMILEFVESGHPIFRATTPLSRGQLKSKSRGKLSIHNFADLEMIQTFSHIYFCKSAQSLRSSRRSVRRVQDPSRQIGATRCQSGMKYLTRAERDMDNEFKSYHDKTVLLKFVLMPDS